MAGVALDADVVIAFLDAADDLHERAVDELRPLLAAGDPIVISASVYAEILIRPTQRGTDAEVDDFLDAIGATVVAVDRALARRAAQLRARHAAMRLPDALSLATALAAGVRLLTFDRKLQRIARRECASA
ncbi:MAG: PIN domain-containing protein [Solirubrobacteraceae bacterium]